MPGNNSPAPAGSFESGLPRFPPHSPSTARNTAVPCPMNSRRNDYSLTWKPLCVFPRLRRNVLPHRRCLPSPHNAQPQKEPGSPGSFSIYLLILQRKLFASSLLLRFSFSHQLPHDGRAYGTSKLPDLPCPFRCFLFQPPPESYTKYS